MALTPEQKAARMAELKKAREEKYFAAQAESKAAAAAKAPKLPASDAYNYNYAWKQDVGAPTGELKLVKTPNPYYDPASNTIVNPATGETTDATQSMWSGPTTFRGDATSVSDPYAGLTPEQVAAKKNAEALAAQLGLSIDPKTGMIIKPPKGFVIDPKTGKFVDPKTLSQPGKTETGRVTNPDGSVTISYSDGSKVTIPASPGGVGGDGSTGFGTSGTGFSGTGSTSVPGLARDTFRNTLALFFGAGEMAKPWVNELYNVVSKFYLTGSTVDESLNLALQDARNNPNLAEFTKRFKGIYDLQDLRQQGKPVTVPTIAEYVKTQSEMADLLVSSGLKDVATEEFTSSLIGKGLSYSTVADRLVKVFDRIDRAPKVIKDTLSRYFPTVDRTTLAKTLLLGEKGVKQLQDELAGYEILSAAEAQGIAATGAAPRIGGITSERAMEYGALGETFESITPKLSQVAIATPRVSQLAGFSRVQDIGQEGVEKAVISRSAKELQQLEELTKQEEARFAGKAGRAELGLASQRRANRAF